MKTRTLAIVGAVLVAPTALFVTASILKYQLGVPFLYDSLGGAIEVMDSPFVILGGLLAALALNLWPVLRVSVKREPDAFVGTVTVRPQVWNVAVLGLSTVLLATIMVYLVMENLHHAG